MWGFTNSGGSDLLNAFAIITVSYPEGATCTCSNGAVTLTAGDTSGLWAFGVPVGGNWTIRATSESQEKAENINITTYRQIARVDITYPLYLLKDGIFNKSLGNLVKTSLVNFINGKIEGTYNSEACAAFSFSNKIIVPNLKTLNMRLTQSSVGYYEGSMGFTFGLASNNSLPTLFSGYSWNARTQITTEVSQYTKYSLSVASFVGQSFFVKGTAASKYSVDAIWFE